MYYEGELTTGSVYLDTKEDDSAATLSAGLAVRYTPPKLQAMTVALGYDVYAFKAEDDAGTYNAKLGMGKLGIQYNF